MRTNPLDQTTTGSCLLVIRVLLRHVIEIGTLLQLIVDTVYTSLGSSLLFLGSILSDMHKDMSGKVQIVTFETLHHIVIVVTDFCLFCSWSNKHGSNLLIAILTEFLLITGQSIQFCILCSLHLQLIVYEQVYIFQQILLVQDAFRVVLVIVVLKFRTRNGFAIDTHYDGILLLRSSCQAHYTQKSSDDCLFHFNLLVGTIFHTLEHKTTPGLNLNLR